LREAAEEKMDGAGCESLATVLVSAFPLDRAEEEEA